jgi:hypothetical protein
MQPGFWLQARVAIGRSSSSGAAQTLRFGRVDADDRRQSH